MWKRINDPLSPLFGADVRGLEIKVEENYYTHNSDKWFLVTHLRRLDLIVGNKPFQLSGGDDGHIGMIISCDFLIDSPVNEDTIEFDSLPPYGKFLGERLEKRLDGLRLESARFENSVQASLFSGDLFIKRMFLKRNNSFDADEVLNQLYDAFKTASQDEVQEMMIQNEMKFVEI